MKVHQLSDAEREFIRERKNMIKQLQDGLNAALTLILKQQKLEGDWGLSEDGNFLYETGSEVPTSGSALPTSQA